MSAPIRIFLTLAMCLALSAMALGQEALWQQLNAETLSLLKKGKYTEGVDTAKKALDVAKKTFGSDNTNTATAQHNLAELYFELGKYSEADPLLIQSLSIREKFLGPDHPDVANSLNNLGGLYCTLGKYNEADPLLKRSFALREQAFGPDHPDVSE